MICILAASDIPSARAVLFGALTVALAGIVLGALWKLVGYGATASIEKALNKAMSGRFDGLDRSIEHLHECVERRLTAVEDRETSAMLLEMRRIADSVARLASPSRSGDPAGADHLGDRATPPSES